MENLRLFLGLDLPEDVDHLLSERAERLRSLLSFHNWSHSSDYHATMHFLGQVPASALPAISSAVTAAASEAIPFGLAIGKLQIFGSPAAPRILSCSLEETEPAMPGGLTELHAAIGDQLIAETDYQPELRPYSPHITLARKGFHPCQPDELAHAWHKACSADAEDPLTWIVRAITLYRVHTEQAPRYEPIAAFPLDLSTTRSAFS